MNLRAKAIQDQERWEEREAVVLKTLIQEVLDVDCQPHLDGYVDIEGLRFNSFRDIEGIYHLQARIIGSTGASIINHPRDLLPLFKGMDYECERDAKEGHP